VDTAGGWRGGQSQVLLTAQGMATVGHDVVLACRAGGELESRARAAGLRVRPVPFRGDLWPPAVAALASVLRAEKPAVAHLHDPHAVSAGLIARRLAGRVPVVATRRVDFRLKSSLSRAKYRSCERVIAVSTAIRDVLLKARLPAETIRLVHEGVRDAVALPDERRQHRERERRLRADVRMKADGAHPGLVLTQDITVLAGLQRGLHQPGLTHLTLSNEERRVINTHRNLERYLDLPESDRITGGETPDSPAAQNRR
jgi:hypothetical protein